MSLLTVNDIKASESGTILLDGLSFEISEKGIYAILAKNKKAKTLLARVLAGISELDSGEIIFKDTALIIFIIV